MKLLIATLFLFTASTSIASNFSSDAYYSYSEGSRSKIKEIILRKLKERLCGQQSEPQPEQEPQQEPNKESSYNNEEIQDLVDDLLHDFHNDADF